MVGRRVASVAPAGADTTSAIASCRTGPKLVDVYYRNYDDQLLNAEGRVVGLASGTGRFELYRKGPNTFCAVSSLTGTFRLFGGENPAGTRTVPAGLRGHVVGVNVLETHRYVQPAPADAWDAGRHRLLTSK